MTLEDRHAQIRPRHGRLSRSRKTNGIVLGFTQLVNTGPSRISYQGNKSHHCDGMYSNNAQRKRKEMEVRFFKQTVCQNTLFVLQQTVFSYITPPLQSKWATFSLVYYCGNCFTRCMGSSYYYFTFVSLISVSNGDPVRRLTSLCVSFSSWQTDPSRSSKSFVLVVTLAYVVVGAGSPSDEHRSNEKLALQQSENRSDSFGSHSKKYALLNGFMLSQLMIPIGVTRKLRH
ncbi:hypothetical protein KIN20_024654 [Parelaphostrongylus tenuis]|uniref:7TM GPCR serpentine receptor class x (Srx) domain-containing protein n=1 Tax=Parelaphostrongylus tenuis TaxID=148309 RepID=A0AAD5MYJ3_PARTN|nr:hypothetical protein KIN20_024654 [Parelaphostrongylus tenuis]